MWTTEDQEGLIQALKKHQDEAYAQFHSSLGVGTVMGVRTPILERIAREIVKQGRAWDYLTGYQKTSYELDVIYGMMIGYAKLSQQERFDAIAHFSGLVDNWATCDLAVARWKFLKQEQSVYITLIDELLASQQCWPSRVAYVMLLDGYLNEPGYQMVIARLKQPILAEYYVEMAAAWLISMGLVKFPGAFETLLIQNIFSPFVYQKTLQKAIESRQIDPEKKKMYRNWKKQLTVELKTTKS